MPNERARLAGGFRAPPAEEYGNVPFWWWDGDELDAERITDQLETLAERGVEAVCFEQKYPHGPPEGPQCAYFSEEWWEYMEHAAAECDRLGMALWIHDLTYHHSPPSWKRYWQDAIEREAEEDPDLRGHVLDRVATDVAAGETATLDVPERITPVEAAAYPRGEDGLDLDGAVPLDADGGVEWTAPDDGDYHVSVVGYRQEGLCRTTSAVVERLIERHYEAYEDRLGEYLGESIVGTFQDELFVLQGTVPCDERLLARYRAEWGEDPDLVALFEDCGSETGTERTRYYDVVTTMLEEHWFRPLYEWHERRGLRFAHDNWGRDSLAEHHSEYGDYVRAMRWFQEPGYDDGLRFEGVGTRSFFDGKVASSIAANYDRERVWGELFHTTGWGFPPSLQYPGIAENVCYGLNHFNKHGLYYATLGGWYEHAPPDTHFRQPYWEHADAFNDAVTRLMYLFSQGDPVVDVALSYPMATMQAGRVATAHDPKPGPGARYPVEMTAEAEAIDETTREAAKTLFESVGDLLFVDHETLADGHAADGELHFAGHDAPVFVLGPATTVRRVEAATALEVLEAGGLVVSLGRLPSATVEGGSEDATLADLRDCFDGDGVTDHESGGAAVRNVAVADLPAVVDEYVARDVVAPDDVYHAHRRVGDQDVYLVLNTADEARTETVSFRADGAPERWDLEAGAIRPVHAFERDGAHTALTLDFAPHEFHVVVFDGAAEAGAHATETTLADLSAVQATAEGAAVHGHARESGTHTASAVVDGETVTGEADATVPEPVRLDSGWTLDLDPTMENRWGDFRYPRGDTVGPEVRVVRVAREEGTDGREAGWHAPDFDDGDWGTTRPTVAPHFWRRPDVSGEVRTPATDTEGWKPYEFSLQTGRPGTHPDDHGFNGVVGEEFLVAPDGEGPTHFWTTVTGEGTVACHYGPGVVSCRVDGEAVSLPGDGGTVELDLAGTTPVHLVVEPDTETHLVFEPTPVADPDLDHVPRLRWFHETDALGYDPRPWLDEHVSWLRFELPVGTTEATVPTAGETTAWVDGERRSVDGGLTVDGPATEPVPVALRVVHDAGAPLRGPVAVETAPVEVDAGDWRDLGLQSYSGVGTYTKTVTVPEVESGDRVVLDLGDVAVTASVSVDGEHVGTVFARPFEVDVTDAVTPGENEVTVRVANTVANHFATETPTRYVYEGQRRSGLRGPVRLRVERAVRVDAA